MFRDHRLATFGFVGMLALALAGAGMMPVLSTTLFGGGIGQMQPGHNVVGKDFGGRTPCWKARATRVHIV
jgi:hypothetical protein